MGGQPEIVTLEPTPTAAVRGTVTMDGLREFYDSSFGKVAAAAARQGATPTAAYGLYAAPPGERFDLEVGFVVSGGVEADGEVVPSSLPADGPHGSCTWAAMTSSGGHGSGSPRGSRSRGCSRRGRCGRST